MDVRDYCNSLSSEITEWKSKLSEITDRMEKSSPEKNRKYSSSISELKSVISDLETGIAELENECPVNWAPQKESLDRKMEVLRTECQQVTEDFSPDDFE